MRNLFLMLIAAAGVCAQAKTPISLAKGVTITFRQDITLAGDDSRPNGVMVYRGVAMPINSVDNRSLLNDGVCYIEPEGDAKSNKAISNGQSVQVTQYIGGPGNNQPLDIYGLILEGNGLSLKLECWKGTEMIAPGVRFQKNDNSPAVIKSILGDLVEIAD
jgi:hypothetical protein